MKGHNEMRIRRLGWDGLEVTAQGESLVIDYVQDSSGFLRANWRGGVAVPPLRTPAVAALVTHLHEDHTDVAAIESAVGQDGIVLRPKPFDGSAAEVVFTTKQEDDFAASKLDVRTVSEWAQSVLGPFTVTAVPAIDGLGDPQLNWVVEAEGARLFHGGDTMFHGYWWLIAGRLGPIDVAALPINGAVVDVPHLQPASTLAACMGPREAVQAAVNLQAKVLLPLHYGVVGETVVYIEDDAPLEHVKEMAQTAGQRVVSLNPGETFDVAQSLRDGQTSAQPA